MNSKAEPASKRRKKLVKPRLQLRIIGSFFGLAILGFLLQSLLLSSYLTDVAVEMPSGGTYLLGRVTEILGKTLIVSLAILLPLVMAIGIHCTFRFSGPLYRFEQHLAGILRGEDMGKCRIRKGDDLQEFCALLNRTLAHLQKDQSAGDVQDPAEEKRAA